MPYNSVHPDYLSRPAQRVDFAQGLTLPASPAKESVVCLTEHELDVAQDLVEFFKPALEKAQKDSLAALTVAKVEYLFDVAVTLFAAGAPPRLVAEALLHPLVAPEGVVASPEKRSRLITDYLARRFNERPFLAAENKLSQVPVGSINYESPKAPAEGQGNWSEIKQEILTPILEKLRGDRDFSPVYTDDQMSFILHGFRTSLNQIRDLSISGASELTSSDAIWKILYNRIEIGLLLLFAQRSADVVVAGLFHDHRETTPPEQWPRARCCLDDQFGYRVGELVELIGCPPAAQPIGNGPEQQVFEEPVLLAQTRNCRVELRTDLEALIAAKVSSLLARELMEMQNLARLVSIPMRGIPDVFVTGIQDWADIGWGEKLSGLASYCDCIYENKHFRPIFDRTIRAWAKAPKFLTGTIALMTARKAFEELFPRSLESPRARLDSMDLVHKVMRTGLGAGSQAKATAYLLSSYERHSGHADRCEEVRAQMEIFEDRLFADQSRTPQIVMEIKPVTYTESERILIVRAVDYIAEFFCRPNLRDMARNPVDQMKHCCEVGFLLMRAGVKADVLIAGLLHDVYELAPMDELSEIRQEVLDRFADIGERVDALIEIVTEPPKDPLAPTENYIVRKSKIISALHALHSVDPFLARDAATIVCAAKMSTMRDGYHFASDFAKVQPWTKGSWSENVRAMCGLHDTFERLGILPQLLGAYREELREWIDVTRYMIPSLKDNIRVKQRLKLSEKVSGLDDCVKTLFHVVQGYHRAGFSLEANDMRLLVSQASAVTAEIPQHAIPVDPESATIGELATFLNEVGRVVFLSRGIYLFSRIADDLCEIVSGAIADREHATYSYLGKQIGVFDVSFDHGLNNLADVSATIDGRILIDRALSALHGRRVIENVNSFAQEGHSTAIRLVEAIIKHRISPDQFEQIQGYDRHLFQQLACAEDSRYLELLVGENEWRFNDFRYVKDLLKGDEGINWVFRFGTNLGHILIRQCSAVLGGLDKQLRNYLSKDDFVNAKICFLTAYFNFQCDLEQPAASLMSFVRKPIAELFLRKMNNFLSPQFLNVDMFTCEEWISDVQKVSNAVQQTYREEFYDLNERMENIAFVDTAQGRTSHPSVLVERKG